MLAAGVTLGSVGTPPVAASLLPAVPTIPATPVVTLTRLVTRPPARRLDGCDPRAGGSNPGRVSLRTLWIMHFAAFLSQRAQTALQISELLGCVENIVPTLPNIDLARGDIELLFIHRDVFTAFLLALCCRWCLCKS